MIHPLSKAVTLTLHTSCSVLFNRGDAIVWQITVICCSIQAGAWSSLVGCPWGYEGIFALIGNVLRRGVEWGNAKLNLSFCVTSAWS
jgi:hypothetical protein